MTEQATRCDLPVGTRVRVTPPRVQGLADQLRYSAKVVGYDDGRTKYHLAREYLPGKYSDGGWWAFPGEVEPIEEGQ